MVTLQDADTKPVTPVATNRVISPSGITIATEHLLDDERNAALMRVSNALHRSHAAGEEVTAGDEMGDFRILAVASETLSAQKRGGYQGWLIENSKTGEHVVVHDSTNCGEFCDITADAAIVCDTLPRKQFDAAQAFVDKTRRDGETLSHFGHSLGGTLAEACVALYSGDTGVAVDNPPMANLPEMVECDRPDFQKRMGRYVVAMADRGVGNLISSGKSAVADDMTRVIEIPVGLAAGESKERYYVDESGRAAINARAIFQRQEEEVKPTLKHMASKAMRTSVLSIAANHFGSGAAICGFSGWSMLSHEMDLMADALDNGQAVGMADYREHVPAQDALDKGRLNTAQVYLRKEGNPNNAGFEQDAAFWDVMEEGAGVKGNAWKTTVFHGMRRMDEGLLSLATGRLSTVFGSRAETVQGIADQLHSLIKREAPEGKSEATWLEERQYALSQIMENSLIGGFVKALKKPFNTLAGAPNWAAGQVKSELSVITPLKDAKTLEKSLVRQVLALDQSQAQNLGIA